jgi:protein Mpv17
MSRIIVVLTALCMQSSLTGAWLTPAPLALSGTATPVRSRQDGLIRCQSWNSHPFHRDQRFFSFGRGQRKSRLTRSALEVAGNGDSSSPHRHQAILVKDETDYEASNVLNKLMSLETEDSSGLSTQQKVINALFLSAAFGYAIYTILNIDAGLTRGWSASEIAMRIPLDNWGAYESYLANKPIVTKTLINVIIYLLGDWLSQTVFQGKNVLDFDISRTLRNGFIGLCFGPCVHQYYEFSDAILPPENGLVTRLEKILMDQTIYLTVKCSIYICAVGLLAGEDWLTVKQRVKDKIVGIVFTAWKFWPLVHCITYR